MSALLSNMSSCIVCEATCGEPICGNAECSSMCKACYRTAFETRMDEYMGPIQMLCPCCHVWLPCDV